MMLVLQYFVVFFIVSCCYCCGCCCYCSSALVAIVVVRRHRCRHVSLSHPLHIACTRIHILLYMLLVLFTCKTMCTLKHSNVHIIIFVFYAYAFFRLLHCLQYTLGFTLLHTLCMFHSFYSAFHFHHHVFLIAHFVVPECLDVTSYICQKREKKIKSIVCMCVLQPTNNRTE